MFKDRYYQKVAVDYCIKYLKDGGNSGLVVAATGTGKSIIIARLIDRLVKANDGLKVLVATHVAELLTQNSEKLRSIFPEADIGIYSAGLGEKNIRQITFAGIQSIFRQAEKLDKINILIIDEAHTIGRKDQSMWLKLINALKAKNPNLKILGLSATPYRLDSGSLVSGDDALFTDIIFDYGMAAAIQDGYLCKLVSKHTETQFDISGVGKIGGEFNLKELQAATNIDSLTKKAVQETIRLCANRKKWLIFCNGVEHSFAVRDELIRQGVTCATVTGDTLDDERLEILQDFKSGKLKAVTNNAVWTTGIDVPDIDAIVMLRHTLSGGLLVQMAGRGTRIIAKVDDLETAKERREAVAQSSKPNCLFLDFAGNIERHGFIDQIKAKDKNKKDGNGIPPVKFCPACFSIVHAAARICPDCGNEFEMESGKTKLGSAYDGEVLSGNEKPEWKNVVRIEYLPHNIQRTGKIPCMRVKYTIDDGTAVNEYICLMHDGFAKQKAIAWWKKMGGGASPDDFGLELICEIAHKDLKKPSRLLVGKQDKYDRVLDYDFISLEQKEELSTSETWFDIPFM